MNFERFMQMSREMDFASEAKLFVGNEEITGVVVDDKRIELHTDNDDCDDAQPHSAPDATPREANEVNVCGMHVVAFSENCDICNADRRAAAERSRVRKEALEACCTVVCNLCAQHIQFSKEADLPHYHNVGTDTDLDYRPCKAASVRSLLAKEGL